MVIGYDADVYRGEIRAVRHFPVFSLFTGYFGHLAQGPVDSYKETGESGLLSSARGFFRERIWSEKR